MTLIPINYSENTFSVEVKRFPTRDLQCLYHWAVSSARSGAFDELLSEFGFSYVN